MKITKQCLKIKIVAKLNDATNFVKTELIGNGEEICFDECSFYLV